MHKIWQKNRILFVCGFIFLGMLLGVTTNSKVQANEAIKPDQSANMPLGAGQAVDNSPNMSVSISQDMVQPAVSGGFHGVVGLVVLFILVIFVGLIFLVLFDLDDLGAYA